MPGALVHLCLERCMNDMKLLFHTCCAPCLIYPLGRLKEKGFEVTGFFYNPNIHSFSEYNKRKEALVEFNQNFAIAKFSCRAATPQQFAASGVNKKNVIDIIYLDYVPSEFFRAINLKENKSERCAICWRLRLTKTAEFAKEKGFDCFSTTLLVSPYQDQESLRKTGEDISRELKVIFYYEDFRPGFKKAQELAKEEGIYRQKYCGCIYSEMERYKKTKVT